MLQTAKTTPYIVSSRVHLETSRLRLTRIKLALSAASYITVVHDELQPQYRINEQRNGVRAHGGSIAKYKT